jgi:hypothetical protein
MAIPAFILLQSLTFFFAPFGFHRPVRPILHFLRSTTAEQRPSLNARVAHLSQKRILLKSPSNTVNPNRDWTPYLM